MSIYLPYIFKNINISNNNNYLDKDNLKNKKKKNNQTSDIKKLKNKMTGQPSKQFINSVLNSRDWEYYNKRIALGIGGSLRLANKESGKKVIFKDTIKHYYSGPPSEKLAKIMLHKTNNNK